MARIIIVEDDDLIAEIASEALIAAGHLASTTADGAEVIDDLRRIEPDLIILDYNLPGLTGMEVLRRIREQRHSDAVPVIMLTSNRTKLLKARAEQAGVDDYVVKPFVPEDLVRRVEALLVGRAISLAAQRSVTDAALVH